MLNKLFITSFTIISLFVPHYALAQDDSCEVQVAVASPPIGLDQSVAFNVTNDNGLSKSVIMNGGDRPRIIGKLTCSPLPYSISATAYLTTQYEDLSRIRNQPIGECVLKAGAVVLNGSNNSVAVVFPNDFICNH